MWIKGNWHCMVLLLSCDKPWYKHCFPSSACVEVWEGVVGVGGALNPSVFAFPSKGLCEECWEFNWSWSVPVWLPALLPAHVLGTTELPETGHRSTTPPWETEQNENTFKKMSFQPYSWSAWDHRAFVATQQRKYHSAHQGIHSSHYIASSITWNLFPGLFTWETQYAGSKSTAQ